MFEKKTVFVLGAGSSFEVGLPVGNELLQVISKKVNVLYDEFGNYPQNNGADLDLWSHLQHCVDRTYLNRLQEAGWKIRDGASNAKSIDDLLFRYQEDELIELFGKAAIAKSILEAERKSPLFVDKNKNEKHFKPQVNSTWFNKIFKSLATQHTTKTVDSFFKNVSFINFNYDRCLEQFFFHELQMAFCLQPTQSQQIIDGCKILRPYGCIGPLINPKKTIPFGHSNNHYQELSQNIKTYTEQVEDKTYLKAIKNEMVEAHTIVFLGFGFHKQNMDILKPEGSSKVRQILATTYGFSQPDQEAVKKQIIDLFDGLTRAFFTNEGHTQIHLAPLECFKLFEVYSRFI